MLYDVLLQKLLAVGRQMERGHTTYGTKKDFYSKVKWLINVSSEHRCFMVDHLSVKYKLEE